MQKRKGPWAQVAGEIVHNLYECLANFAAAIATGLLIFGIGSALVSTPAQAAGRPTSCSLVFENRGEARVPARLDIWELAMISGLDPMQIHTLSTNSAGIHSIPEIMRLGIPESSFLLGPAGNNYDLLLARFRLKDFWQAYDAVGLSALADQSYRDRHTFLSRLTSQDHSRIYFLIPENYSATRHTAAELKILLENPELLDKIHFIYGPEDFADGALLRNDSAR